MIKDFSQNYISRKGFDLVFIEQSVSGVLYGNKNHVVWKFVRNHCGPNKGSSGQWIPGLIFATVGLITSILMIYGARIIKTELLLLWLFYTLLQIICFVYFIGPLIYDQPQYILYFLEDFVVLAFLSFGFMVVLKLYLAIGARKKTNPSTLEEDQKFDELIHLSYNNHIDQHLSETNFKLVLSEQSLSGALYGNIRIMLSGSLCGINVDLITAAQVVGVIDIVRLIVDILSEIIRHGQWILVLMFTISLEVVGIVSAILIIYGARIIKKELLLFWLFYSLYEEYFVLVFLSVGFTIVFKLYLAIRIHNKTNASTVEEGEL